MLAVIGFAAEDFVGVLCKKWKDLRILFCDALVLLCILATVFFWRGLWTLLEICVGENGKRDSANFLFNISSITFRKSH